MMYKFSIIVILLLIYNTYLIKEGYDYSHIEGINKRDGQYGMVYGFYIIGQMMTFLISGILMIVLLKKRTVLSSNRFKIILSVIIINPIVAIVGWMFLD